MVGRVYLVTNKVNGKKYVGFTVRSISARWKDHVWDARSNSNRTIIDHAIRKYGAESFKIRELYSGTVENALQMESVFIKKYKTFGKGYNLTYGGEGTVGWVPSEEQCEKMSLVKKGKPGYWKGKSGYWKGRKRSKKTCEKMSRSAKGRPKPWQRGQKRSKETCEKMSCSAKGKPKPWLRGRKLSKEHCEKISVAQIARWKGCRK